MTEEKLLVRLSGTSAEILKELVQRGYFSTKSEALRAGILKLGEAYGLLKPAGDYWRELGLEVNRAKRKLTHERIAEAIERLEQEA